MMVIGDGGMVEARVVVMTVLIVTQPNVVTLSGYSNCWSGQWSVVSGQWSMVNGQWSGKCHLSLLVDESVRSAQLFTPPTLPFTLSTSTPLHQIYPTPVRPLYPGCDSPHF